MRCLELEEMLARPIWSDDEEESLSSGPARTHEAAAATIDVAKRADIAECVCMRYTGDDGCGHTTCYVCT